MVTGLLNNAGWHVNHKRVERRREGLKVPQKQRKKGRLWLNDGSCVRLKPERANHVWSYDFVQDRTADGWAYRTLNIIDEYTREALMIRVDRKLNSTDVLDALTDLFILRGPPEYIWAGIYCPESAGLDRCRRRQDGIHRTGITLGKWILRKLQRTVPRSQRYGSMSWRRLILNPQILRRPERAAGPEGFAAHLIYLSKPPLHPAAVLA